MTDVDSDDDNAGDTIPAPPPELCLCSFGELCVYYGEPLRIDAAPSEEFCARCGGTRR